MSATDHEPTPSARTARRHQPDMLLERDAELSALSRLADGAREGRGGVLIVSGPAGIGKTTLLKVWRSAGTCEDVRFLRAQGSELERDFPYGVARQLLEPVVLGAPPAERRRLFRGTAKLAAPLFSSGVAAEDATPDSDGLRRGLYWLLHSMVERRPALILLDDAHLADQGSLEWLRLVTRRAEELPLGVVVAHRPAAPGHPVNALLDEPAARILSPSPLSPEATAAMVRDAVGGAPNRALGARVHVLTGGNPLRIREVLEARARALADGASDDLTALEGLRSERLLRDVHARTRDEPSAVTAVLEALAITGDRAPASVAAEVANVSGTDAARAVDRLVALDLLAPQTLRFTHPLLAASVDGGIAPGRRSILHDRAARALARRAAPVEQIAAHLLEAPAAADAWVVDQLVAAAGRFSSRAAPGTAARYLRRALDEPPPPGQRVALMQALGLAEAAAQDRAAVAHLTRAVELADAPADVASSSIALARVLTTMGASAQAITVLGDALPAIAGDEDLELSVLSERLMAVMSQASSCGWPRHRIESLRDHLHAKVADRTPATQAERVALSAVAVAVAAASSAPEGIRLAGNALADGQVLRLVTTLGPAGLMACVALIWSGVPREARTHLDRALEITRSAGSASATALVLSLRAEAQFEAGEVRGAVVDASEATQLPADGGPSVPQLLAPAWLVRALLEQGRADEAFAVLRDRQLLGPLPADSVFAPLLYARAELHHRRGDLQAALADVLAAGCCLTDAAMHGPSMLPWRDRAALVLIDLGERQRAAAINDEQMQLARRFGAAGPLGSAMRVAALLARDGDRRAEALAEAAEVLEDAGAPLVHARTLIDLGRAVRHKRAIQDARETLLAALEIADECGARALASEARAELAMAGARPRRPARHGRDSLTAGELRVAEHAAAGLSNREIAERLFVTVKTVETHLRHVYVKLGATRRNDLPALLR